MDSEISSLARVHANALLLSLTVKPRTGVFSKKVHGRFGRVSEKRVRPLPAVLAAPSRPCLHAPDSWWTMSWPQPLVLALLAVLVAVTCEYVVSGTDQDEAVDEDVDARLFSALHQADSAAASDDDTVNIKMALEEGGLRKIVMHEADASNFFRRRGRRSTKSQDELNGHSHTHTHTPRQNGDAAGRRFSQNREHKTHPPSAEQRNRG
ncbi:uncharacterized protein LOC114779513 isoform X2 [Denticeps clupeoides]|uniref:uncharacterized protein LOC114779513 isoform X2 n=1 Tax=Denticeps clupeoides TaxID=299321 RepID=UPI0010A30B72|nr:uncharacterized protein LOC114779513 isoform X2 [Denticeps clupeoides]